MYNPHQVTREFEAALCVYTGAKYAVTTNSCTMAILLAVAWLLKDVNAWLSSAEQKVAQKLPKGFPDFRLRMSIQIPSRTYISVPMSIIHAGGKPVFDNRAWRGSYQLKPLAVWDSARRFTSGMYIPGQFQCVSFHASKILSDSQGGAILHDNDEADAWLRKARFDGRTEGVAPKDDHFDMLGWHCYMSPDVAARLLWKLSVLPKHNPDLPNDDYPDLSKMEIFK